MHGAIRSELTIESADDYFCLTAIGQWGVVNSRDIRQVKEDTNDTVPFMSLRLSTGIIGRLDCPAGNNGPKGANEVVLGAGKDGIEALLRLRPLPCVTCHSWRDLQEIGGGVALSLAATAGTMDHATDPEWLREHYDARRLNWPSITPLGVAPSRFYTRPGLTAEKVGEIAAFFEDESLPAPTVGYYDHSSPDHFTAY